MNNITKIIIITVISLLLTGCFSEEPLLQKDSIQRKIVCLGDSLTAGHGVDIEDNYPTLLSNRLKEKGYTNYEVINQGISGDTTMDVLKRLDQVISEKPDLVILGIGANDGLRRKDHIETKANLKMIIQKIQNAQIKILLLGMKMPINLGLKYSGNFNVIYPEIATEMNVPLVPFMLDGVANYKNLNNSDGIHPNAEGYKIVLKNIWEYLE